jgi:hypothetical protein
MSPFELVMAGANTGFRDLPSLTLTAVLGMTKVLRVRAHRWWVHLT